MCGFCGIIRFDDQVVDHAVLKAMSQSIAHRGPDESRVWINQVRNVGLAHQRLAIIDLSSDAGQPMHLDSNLSIVFNGEIYNYIELREDLIKQGVNFKTQSDTEVLIQLFKIYGKDCLEKLDGMFAFAIYNQQTKEIFLARDRVGEKPLYYVLSDNYFLFGSEIKSFFPYMNLKVDLDRVSNYLFSGEILYHHGTCFKQVESMPAASWMSIQNGNKQIGTYWEIDLSKKVRYTNEQDYIDHFRELFDQSVKRRLRSDVTVGSSLSGGIDSSSIVCSVSKQSKLKYKTFSARFPGAEKDEGVWIDKVVQKTGVENISILPQANAMLDLLKKLLWHQEFLIGSSSIFAQYEVMQSVRANEVIVLLDGQGADEFLAGYDNLRYYSIWDAYRRGDWKRFKHESKTLRAKGNKVSVGWMFLLDPILIPLGIKRSVYQNGTTLKEQLKYSITTTLAELLRYADRNSMAASVEVRLPFTYHKLIEFAFAIPDELIYKNGRTKYILRESMREDLPYEIYNRIDKIGFAPPQNNWIQTEPWQKEFQRSVALLSEKGIDARQCDTFRTIISANFLETFSLS